LAWDLELEKLSVHCKLLIRNAFKMLVGKPERRRQLGRPGHKWENRPNINTSDLTEDMKIWIALIWLSVEISNSLL
jgi:hypothetical protein